MPVIKKPTTVHLEGSSKREFEFRHGHLVMYPIFQHPRRSIRIRVLLRRLFLTRHHLLDGWEDTQNGS
jgi:hypothetical protein